MMTLQGFIRAAILIFVVALFPAGFVVGCLDEKDRHEQTKAAVRAAGEAREKATREQEIRDRQAKLETEMNHANELKARDARFSALYARYAKLLNTPSSSSLVSGRTAGSTEPVPASGVVCFKHDELERGIQQALGRFAIRALQLLQRGEDGLDDRRWWGDFARRIEACPSPKG